MYIRYLIIFFSEGLGFIYIIIFLVWRGRGRGREGKGEGRRGGGIVREKKGFILGGGGGKEEFISWGQSGVGDVRERGLFIYLFFLEEEKGRPVGGKSSLYL